MAAPLGFKTFNTGDVLSAADTNGYLMQGIWVFANATARDAAVTSPQEGNSCYLKDTDVIQVYSGSSWVVKSGGSSPLTTKGDLYTYSTTDARLAVGANGTTLVADSAETTGLKWVTPASGAPASDTNRVTTSQSTSSGSYTDLATSQSVTLTTGTKALVLITSGLEGPTSSATGNMSVAVSGASTVAANDQWCIREGGDLSRRFGSSTLFTGLTAGSNTFTAKFRVSNGASFTFFNREIIVIDMGS
jgi:hypothetical protein